MNEKSLRNAPWLHPFLIFCCLTVAVTSLGGCESVRRKFVRKKTEKVAGEDYIPVLEPVDYTSQQFYALERYRYHYSIWLVWHKELLQEIQTNDNDKKQQYLVDQLISQVQAMQQWLIAEKREGLAVIEEDLGKIKKEYEKSMNLRNMFRIKRDLIEADRRVRDNFNPKTVGPYVIGDPSAPEDP